jgi:hypothetical protein
MNNQIPTTEVDVVVNTINPPLAFNFFETYIRHIKAFKSSIDPFSECLGVVTGTACFCLMLGAQAEENSRPATRHDVLYAREERRRDREELGTSFAIGYCIGDALVDTASIAFGASACIVPAVYRSLFNPLLSTDSVCGISATAIDETKLFDSCTCSSSMQR